MNLKRKILVIDDENQVANMLAEFCESFGFDTQVLNSGERAVEFVKSYRPDLVTVDLVMPGTSGLDVIENLRKDPETRSIPIIVISSYEEPENVGRPVKLTHAILSKPVSMKDLELQIKIALASKN